MLRLCLFVFSILFSASSLSSCDASQAGNAGNPGNPGNAGNPGAGDVSRVLFIGNSLTYVNDLPGNVQALADSGGTGPLTVETVALPDFALVDHWNEGSALRAIRRGSWDLVVLQQGPSSVAANRDTLRLFARRFGAEIAQVGGRTGLYSVWPMQSRQEDFPRAIESYRLAAADIQGVLLPVATAWLAAWRRDTGAPLYSSDGLHPTVEGSYLAALVIYGKLANRSPMGLPAKLRLRSGAVIAIEGRWASILQMAASEANQ